MRPSLLESVTWIASGVAYASPIVFVGSGRAS
jgi:hypothetical protein